MAIRILFLLLLVSLTACTFSKTRVNKPLRGLDTSSIEVGKTTWREVLRILGPPTPSTSQENPLKNVSLRHLKYVSWENKKTALLFGYIAILNFDWSDSQNEWELMLEFDESGVLSGAYCTTNDTIWKPFEGEGSREPQVNKDLGKGAWQ